ncbi:Protein dopey-1, partial [Characodon lateralis]|nr:Protein dopey-1 [Characodon lateralis]
MALWSKSSPSSFCLSRYAPPLRCPVRQAGNGNKTLHLSRFMLPVTSAATSVELRVSKCATKMDVPNIYFGEVRLDVDFAKMYTDSETLSHTFCHVVWFQATRPDMIRILSAALHVVLRRDMSLNRRLYAWLLGPRSTRQSNPEEHASHYFNSFSKDMLVQAMVGILQGKARGGEEESILMHDLKPFRILISLLDKPELGPAILEDVLIEVFRTLHTQCRTELDLQSQSPFSKDHTHLSSKLRENKKTAELIKTANLLFNSFEPYYMWDYIARWFEECCRRTVNSSARVARSGWSLESPDLSLVEFCQLVDFLLDIVSL